MKKEVLIRRFSNLDSVIISSLQAGFGLVVLEYSVSGVPFATMRWGVKVIH